MSSAATSIAVNELRVGMFVHLDLGWMSHPFPLGSFRIASDEQIATIRGLGLERLRWSPDKSDAAAPVPEAAQEAAPAAAATAAAAPDPRAARRAALSQQRAALALCERQYAEASRALKLTNEFVASDPRAARERTEALVGALVDKMLGAGEICIRLLTEGAGDRASAHALNVGIIGLLMGKLLGFAEAELQELGVGALLHDVGKLSLPDRVRHPDEHSSAAEVNLYREHVSHGVTAGRKMGLSPGALLVIAQHHEHADGSGFPQRLQGDRMTPAARIVALVNRYDNLCNPPVPSRALTPHEALSLMFSQGKHKYDFAVLNAFIRMMGVYPPGSAVELTDGRHALVTMVNSARPLKPRVLVHDVRMPADEALHLDLEAEPDLGIRRSLKPAQLPPAALAYLAPRPRIAYYFEPAAEPPG